MLNNAGLNTHSNRTISVELKEDGKNPTFVRKIEVEKRLCLLFDLLFVDLVSHYGRYDYEDEYVEERY